MTAHKAPAARARGHRTKKRGEGGGPAGLSRRENGIGHTKPEQGQEGGIEFDSIDGIMAEENIAGGHLAQAQIKRLVAEEAGQVGNDRPQGARRQGQGPQDEEAGRGRWSGGVEPAQDMDAPQEKRKQGAEDQLVKIHGV